MSVGPSSLSITMLRSTLQGLTRPQDLFLSGKDYPLKPEYDDIRFPRFRTYRGARRCWAQRHPNVQLVGIEECHLEILWDILYEFHALSLRYPHATVYLQQLRFGMIPGYDGTPAVHLREDRAILIDPEPFAPESVTDSLLPSLLSEAEHLCAHEFGHVLMCAYLFDPRTSSLMADWLDELDPEAVADDLNEDYVTSHPTPASNKIECFAELFAEGDRWRYGSSRSEVSFRELMQELDRLSEVGMPCRVNTDQLAWHYTTVARFRSILADGAIRVEIGPKYEAIDLLWFSDEPLLEDTIHGKIPLNNRLASTGCFYRFGIPIGSHQMVDWNRVEPYTYMGTTAALLGEDTTHTAKWYVVTDDVPVSDCVVEVLVEGKWLPAGGSYPDPHALSRYHALLRESVEDEEE